MALAHPPWRFCGRNHLPSRIRITSVVLHHRPTVSASLARKSTCGMGAAKRTPRIQSRINRRNCQMAHISKDAQMKLQKAICDELPTGYSIDQIKSSPLSQWNLNGVNAANKLTDQAQSNSPSMGSSPMNADKPAGDMPNARGKMRKSAKPKQWKK
jgi:hypothetical protein